MKVEISRNKKVIFDCFVSPTIKQKEAYGRFFHTLTVAATVGFFAVVHMGNELTAYIFLRAASLFLTSIFLFVVGAIFSKGE